MKIRLRIILVLTIGLTSCSFEEPTQDEIVKRNLESYLKATLNNPESYEFVELELRDSVIYSDNIEYRKKHFQRDLKYNKDKVKMPSILITKEEVNHIKQKIIGIKKILLGIDSLEKELGSKKNDVASYTYIFSFRATNALGAKVLNKYIVQTNPKPDLNIKNMTNKQHEVYCNPNDFPGYREMIIKHQAWADY